MYQSTFLWSGPRRGRRPVSVGLVRLQRAKRVDGGEPIEMVARHGDHLGDVGRRHVRVNVFLRLPLLNGDESARNRLRHEQVVGKTSLVVLARGDKLSE